MTDPGLVNRLADELMAAGRADLAGDLVRAAAAPPADPTASHAAGLRHLMANRPREAEADLRAAVRGRPTCAAWHDHLGVALAQQGRLAEARATFRLALRLDPADPEAAGHFVQTCLDGRTPEAAEAVLPTLAPAVAAGGWYQVGLSHAAAGRFADAVRCLGEHVRLAPDSADGWANLAAACGKLKQWEEAAAAGRRAVESDPGHAAGWSNLGNALRDLGRLPEAIDALTRGTRADPTNADTFANLALCLAMLGRPADALPLYDRAVNLKPDGAELRFNRAVARLAAGDWTGGWPEYEWRWRTDQLRAARRTLPVPEWDGSSLAGKTILVHSEQGVGDALMGLRLVQPLADLGATVLLDVPPPLRRLAAGVPGVSRVLVGDITQVALHAHCPLLGLPLRLRLSNPERLPGRVPYLSAPAERVAYWRQRLAGVPGRKVGIVWQGNPDHIGDRWRSVPLARFAPLAGVPGVSLVVVQRGAGREQLAAAPFPVLDLGADLADDWTDTAGLLGALDLLVSVDTAVVHLAGALGRPGWILLPLNADWRWRHGRADSPWYPSLRLVRQATFGDWGPVFERVAGELAEEPGT